MPGTYEPIATNTISSSTISEVSFTSIPATYTDIVLIIKATASTPTTGRLRFNGVSSNVYSDTFLDASGSATSSFRETNVSALYPLSFYNTGTTNSIIDIMNYAQTTTFKSILVRGYFTTFASYGNGIWSSTNAINSIQISTQTGTHYFGVGSIFTIYGVKAA